MQAENPVPVNYKEEEPLYVDIELETKKNQKFRKVIYTDGKLQVVLQTLQPGEDIGEEVHKATTQFFRVESGRGHAHVGGEVFALRPGIAFTVPFGTRHNVVSDRDSTLAFYTIYSPSTHLPGEEEETKEG